MSRIMQNEALDMNLMVCRCGGCCNNGHMYIVNVEFQKAKYTNVAKTRKVIFICAHMSTTSQYEWLVANLHSPKPKGGWCTAWPCVHYLCVGLVLLLQANDAINGWEAIGAISRWRKFELGTNWRITTARRQRDSNSRQQSWIRDTQQTAESIYIRTLG